MTSVAAAVKQTDWIFDEEFSVDKCNPLLLDQLERQERANRLPIVLRGCEIRIDRNFDTVTITIGSGLVFAPGWYISPIASLTCEREKPRRGLNQIYTVVIRQMPNGPWFGVLPGKAAKIPEPAVPPVRETVLGWVVVPWFGSANLCRTPRTLARARRRIARDEERRDRDERRLEESCPHRGMVSTNITQLADSEKRRGVYCHDCEKSWVEYECGRCGKRNPEPRSCACRTTRAKEQWRAGGEHLARDYVVPVGGIVPIGRGIRRPAEPKSAAISRYSKGELYMVESRDPNGSPVHHAVAVMKDANPREVIRSMLTHHQFENHTIKLVIDI